MIEFKNVSKTYEDTGVRALDDVSFFIDKGEFVFLVGPSGAGKSTLTKLLIKEETPNNGEITVNGFDLNSLTKDKVPYLRRSIGMVFQDFRLLPNKTVYENVAFAMQVIGASKAEIRRNVPNVLSLVGLAHKARMKPGQLSGGEQQRVALARALINKPEILLCDEPTGNLDPKNSWEIMKLLEEFNEAGTTVVVVTHNREIVDAMQKRVITMHKGFIESDEEMGGYIYED